ncbi:CD82 antigen-like [Hetaerina americana]|uniref:CD82 antigen-like n=1 Tax=Hetaerina americana TaxID=62018 RepID=UPI003A7F2C25
MAIKMSAGRSRGLLVGFNLLSWVAGTGLLGFGILMMSDSGMSHLYRVITAYAESNEVALEKATYVVGDGIKYLSYLVTSIAAFILIFGLLGCCGTITESKCLMVSRGGALSSVKRRECVRAQCCILNRVMATSSLRVLLAEVDHIVVTGFTYFVSLFAILCAELGMVVIAIVNRELILDGMEDRMENSMKLFYAQDTTYTNSLDYTQYSEAGGAKVKPNDTPWLNPIPLNEQSCQAVNSLQKNISDEARHIEGCFEKLQNWFKRSTTLIICVGMGLATLSILGMMASICLCRHIEDP